MRNLLLILFLFISTISFGKIPPIISNSLYNHFPTATKVSWNKYIDSLKSIIFEGSFYVNGRHKILLLSEIGTPIELEEDILFSELPVKIKNSIHPKQFTKAVKSYSYEFNNVFYQVDYHLYKKKYIQVIYNDNGDEVESFKYKDNPLLGYVLITSVLIVLIKMLFL